MKDLTDPFFLTAAEISATLIGLLFVGIYYFLETGLGRLEYTREDIEPFIRSMSKLILLLFSLALAISVGLVVLTDPWMRFLFIGVGIYLLVAAIRFALQYWKLKTLFGRRFPSLGYLVSVGLWFVAILGLPWFLGGWTPGREHYGWSLLLSGLLGFMQTGALLLESFDISHQEEAAKLAQLQLDEQTGKQSKEVTWTTARRQGFEKRLLNAYRGGKPFRITHSGSQIQADFELRPNVTETGRAVIHANVTPILVTNSAKPLDTSLVLAYQIAERAIRAAPGLTYVDVRLWQDFSGGGAELLLIAAFSVSKLKSLGEKGEVTSDDVAKILDHRLASPVLLSFEGTGDET